MRTDQGRFADKRVRRAIALCLNRENLVRGMFRGRAALGNDSPFAPIFRRDRSRRAAAPAGSRRGEGTDGGGRSAQRLSGHADHRAFPGDARLRGRDSRTRCARSASTSRSTSRINRPITGGRSSDPPTGSIREMGIEDYAHRGVPNTFLTACLGSRGTFNAAHFNNPEYDRLAASYIAALDPATQRACAGRIQRLLLEETPVIIAYFYDWLSVTAKHISGVRPTATGQLNLAGRRWVRLGPAAAASAAPRRVASARRAPQPECGSECACPSPASSSGGSCALADPADLARTAGVEHAAGRQIQRARQFARQADAPRVLTLEARVGGQQRLGVGMMRTGETPPPPDRSPSAGRDRARRSGRTR